MAEKPRESPPVVRLNLILSKDTNDRLEDAQHALTRQKDRVYVSKSMFFEIAALELLKRRDLAEVLRKHGAKARRDTEKG